MEKPRLEVVVVSSESPGCQKRRVSTPEDDQPVSKRLRTASPTYPLEWEASLQPPRCFVASCLACPPIRLPATQPSVLPIVLPSIQPQKKPPRRAPYDPYDFTSDDLDPAFEWPRESPRARKRGAEVALLKSILSHFPLGLRLNKLMTMMWKEHKVPLLKLSEEQGYGDILRFLEEVPGVRLSVSRGGSHYLVHRV